MGPSPGVKRPEHDNDHPPPSSTKVKNEYRYTPLKRLRRGQIPRNRENGASVH
jgi:hypothetical protein